MVGPSVHAEVHAATKVADGLWLLAGRPRHGINVYVMGDVLVDSGTRHAHKRIAGAIDGLGLSAVVLTHGHVDHMGSAHTICERLGLPLVCGAGDVPVVESLEALDIESKPLFVRIQHRAWAGERHEVDRVLSEGDEVAGFTVLETPGHSAGHLAFWRESDRTLVAGDVFFGVNPKTGRPGPNLPPNVFTPDPELNLASARRLAALEPAVICFGHGPPLRDPARLEAFAASASV
jgi:hydroxyacylglutathione hydrolase